MGVLQNSFATPPIGIMNNIASQQLMRRNAAKPGQGRERMRGQFAGYIPANRAACLRSRTEMSEAPGV